MKKKYLYIILSIVCLFGFNNEVKAAARLQCEYDKKSNGSDYYIFNQYTDGTWDIAIYKSGYIEFNPGKTAYKTAILDGVSYSNGMSLDFLSCPSTYTNKNGKTFNITSNNINSINTYDKLFCSYKINYSNNSNNTLTLQQLSNGKVIAKYNNKELDYFAVLDNNGNTADGISSCPQNVYFSKNANIGSLGKDEDNMAYFADNNTLSQQNQFINGTLSNDNGQSIYKYCDDINWDEQLNNLNSSFSTDDDYVTCVYGYNDLLQNTCSIIKLAYKLGDDSKIDVNSLIINYPSQTKSYIDEFSSMLTGGCLPNLYYKENNKNVSISDSGGNNSNYHDYVLKKGKDINGQFVIEGVVVKTCEDLIPLALREKINEYLTWVKVLVPIIIIGLGVVDFLQSILASDETSMKKAQKKLIMRLIIGIIIFLIPTILNLLLDLANDAWNSIGTGTCGIG